MARHRGSDKPLGKAEEHATETMPRDAQAEKTGEKPSSGKAIETEAEDRSSEQLEEQIRSAEDEAKRHYDKLLRVMAEFENFKKRMHREKAEHAQYSNEKILGDLLPIIDDLDRVADHLPDEISDEVKVLSDGVQLVRKNMLATLYKYGLREVEAIGKPFDPSKHEAVSTEQREGFAPDSIIEVHRKGYMLGDRLLRASMVTVAR